MENVQKHPQKTATPRPWLVRSLPIPWSDDFKESLTSLVLVTFGNLLTGTILGSWTGHLELLPALTVLIPPAIDMRGNIFASLGSRLGTYLHTGQITPRWGGKGNKILHHNANASFILTVVTSIYLGVLATFVARAIGLHANIVDMVLISLLTGLLSASLMLGLTVLIAFSSYRYGWDPDNITSPFITLAGDIITLPLLFLMADLVLDIGAMPRSALFYVFMALGVISLMVPFMEGARPHARRIILESTPLFLVCGLLSVFSGSILGTRVEALIGIAGVFVMIPAFLEDGGAIGGILAAKFSSALHVGSLSFASIPPRFARHLFLTMQLIGLMVFALVGVLSYAISVLLSISTLAWYEMVAVAVLTGQILILIVNLVAYYSSVFTYHMGLDPDNTTIPIITSLMDLVGTATLIAVLLALGLV